MENDIKLVIKEYEECNNGYAYRDELAHTACHNLIQTFYVFVVLLTGASLLDFSFWAYRFWVYRLFCIYLGSAGFFSMLTLFIDFESTVSCKVALRHRSIKLENQLSSLSSSTISMWDSIDNRKKFIEERLIKLNRDRDEPEYNIFVFVFRILILLWVGVVIFIAICGPFKKGDSEEEKNSHEQVKIEDIRNPGFHIYPQCDV